MRLVSTGFFLALALVTWKVAADEDQCGTLTARSVGQPCQCGSTLSNLKVAAPKGMVLKAVCGLFAGARPIDLRTEKVSLDKYPASGNYYSGELYFAGTIVVNGVVRIEASDAGFLWFYPETSLAPYKSVFAHSYDRVLKLDRDIPKAFGLPKDIGDPRWFTSTCSRAAARLRLSAIEVELSEQDSQGAYAIGVEVLSHSSFKKEKCPQ